MDDRRALFCPRRRTNTARFTRLVQPGDELMQRAAYSNATRSLCVLYRLSRGSAISLNATGWTGMPRSVAIDVQVRPRTHEAEAWAASFLTVSSSLARCGGPPNSSPKFAMQSTFLEQGFEPPPTFEQGMDGL